MLYSSKTIEFESKGKNADAGSTFSIFGPDVSARYRRGNDPSSGSFGLISNELEVS